jgi:hypothetical protein
MDMTNIDDFVQVGMDAAREAGLLLRERLQTGFEVLQKGVINLVTEVDLAAEDLIVGRIRKAFPLHEILAEERHSDVSEGSIRWVIDPLEQRTTLMAIRHFRFLSDWKFPVPWNGALYLILCGKNSTQLVEASEHAVMRNRFVFQEFNPLERVCWRPDSPTIFGPANKIT